MPHIQSHSFSGARRECLQALVEGAAGRKAAVAEQRSDHAWGGNTLVTVSVSDVVSGWLMLPSCT